jgi:lipoate-protein ligase A
MAAGAGPGGRWRVEHERGPALELHQGSAALAGRPGGPGSGVVGQERVVRVLTVDRPALVLGSGQPDSDVDTEAAATSGIDIVRRRSGGGAVLVEPGGLLWVDLVIPASDPLWQTDVGRAAWWVGATWASALERTVGGPAEVWRGAMRRSPWSGRVCFAGLGPGEVCVGGQKVVGVSQRRTRTVALFQTAALLRWDPAPLVALLGVDDAARAQARVALAGVAVGVGPEQAGPLLDAFLAALP